MADFTMINGRKIRFRPSELSEIDENGYFQRQPNMFTGHFGGEDHPIENNRYILFWSPGCAWSNRAVIAIDLLGLSQTIKTEAVDWTDRPENLGWEFVHSPHHINPETGAQFLSELYYHTKEDYTGRTTVPALVDYKTKTIVNNDFHTLTILLETEFKPMQKKAAPDLYPLHLKDDIDKLNIWLYKNVNDAIYRACFSRSPQAYHEGYNTFFSSLRTLNERLSAQRFLLGDYITDSDIRLFTTLVRLDVNYSRHLGPCPQIADFPHLWEYAKDLYQIPAFGKHTHFQTFAAKQDTDRQHLNFRFNSYYDMVVPNTDFHKLWSESTKRDTLSSDPENKFITLLERKIQDVHLCKNN